MDFLKTIVETKQLQVKAAMEETSLPALLKMIKARTGYRSFARKLISTRPGKVNIIAEIKRASPSKGVIRENVDPAALAETYERGGATAISVLTETEFFKGGIDDLKAARKAQGLPVLRKDFIISEYQVYESAAIGADAILLIVKILTPTALKRFMSLAETLHLDVLVEVHTEAELEVATQAGATLIGINNRNLDSFETDISIAANMIKALSSRQVPVAASGIGCPEDIQAGMEAGISNFLVGESIMRSSDPEMFLKALQGLSQ